MREIVYTATAADVTTGNTPTLPVDYLLPFANFSLQYLASGGGAGGGTFQVTIDDIYGTNTPTWATVTLTTGRGSYTQPARAFRVLTPTAGDIITILQQGSR